MKIVLHINGRDYTTRDVHPLDTVASFLHKVQLTGTKVACQEGGCGSCTITLSNWDHEKQELVHRAVNACIVPLIYCHNALILTTEGLVKDGKPHPIQERLAHHHGVRCGFCTPGYVMTIFTKLLKKPNCTEEELFHAIESNLCRCTGYRPILEACSSLVSEKPFEDNILGHRPSGRVQVEYPFPVPERIKMATYPSLKYTIKDAPKGRAKRVFAPSTLDELIAIISEYTDARIGVGFSEISVRRSATGFEPDNVVSVWRVPELLETSENNGEITLGAAVTIYEARRFLSQFPNNTRAQSLIARFKRFACPQVRAVAAIGGNICHAHTVSDILPILMASEATLIVKDKTGEIAVPAREFVLGSMKTILKPGQFLFKVIIPPPPTDCTFFYANSYKLTRRYDDDIAMIGGAFELGIGEGVIKRARFVYAALGSFTKPLVEIEEYLEGKQFVPQTVRETVTFIIETIKKPENRPGRMVEYRTNQAALLWFRFAVDAARQIDPMFALEVASIVHEEAGVEVCPDDINDAAEEMPRKGIKVSEQTYDDDEKATGELHVSRAHDAAIAMATGRAEYTSSLAPTDGMMYAYPVYAGVPCARFVELKETEARKTIEGLIVLTAKDIPTTGRNGMGVDNSYERILVPVGSTIRSHGEVLAVAVANTEDAALRGARILRNNAVLQPLPSVTTLDEIMRLPEADRGQHLITTRRIDHYPSARAFESVFRKADHVVESELELGMQDHFYFETHCARATPTEMGGIHIHANLQSASGCQENVADFLGLNHSYVTVDIPRVGGSFGGKESTFGASCLSSLAAFKTGRTVHLQLTRADDIKYTGKNHPFRIKHRVAMDSEGTILAMDVKLDSLAGWTSDRERALLVRALFHANGAYRTPMCRVISDSWRSNTLSSTAYKGFGAPQVTMAVELAMDRCAEKVDMDPEIFREKNFNRPGDTTLSQETFPPLMLKKVWHMLKSRGKLEKRQGLIKSFNATHRFRRRALACIPLIYGITYLDRSNNQATALVHLLKDGSISASQSGVEMGQGIEVKLRALIADELGGGMTIDKIHLNRVSTSTIPSGPPSSAASAADLNGYALLDACRRLRNNLSHIIAEFTDDSTGITEWANVAQTAWHRDRLPLTGFGHYASECPGFNWEHQSGSPFAYYTSAGAAIEVEVDTMTGDWRVIRVDMVMDAGRPINPALDIGHIEGSFMNGLGYVTEDMVFAPMPARGFEPQVKFQRVPLSSGPGSYKIPSPCDVPEEMRVHLLPKSRNESAIHGSKDVAEPALCFGSAAYVAVRRAIRSVYPGGKFDVQLKHPSGLESVHLALPLPGVLMPHDDEEAHK